MSEETVDTGLDPSVDRSKDEPLSSEDQAVIDGVYVWDSAADEGYDDDALVNMEEEDEEDDSGEPDE